MYLMRMLSVLYCLVVEYCFVRGAPFSLSVYTDMISGNEGGMAATIRILLEFDPTSKRLFMAFVESEILFVSKQSDGGQARGSFTQRGRRRDHLKNLLAPILPKEVSFEEIVQMLQAHFDQTLPLVIAERF